MPEVPRISPEDARREVQSRQALLVCAYDDNAKCAQMRLEGAITINELRQRLSSLPREQELILYCA
jgi:hypothetical protein